MLSILKSKLLGNAKSLDDLGQSFGATLTTESLIGAADAGTTPTAAANPANMTTTDSLRTIGPLPLAFSN